MNYPVWDLGFAHGLLIAGVAIFHVYISHFAVGGGLFLVVTETLARRRDDTALLELLHGYARMFILITLVLGAITGVGIWFTIGLINPAGTSSLIHAFVWGWAIEWTFFVTEIAAAMIYYYGWRTLAPRTHLAVGWIYFVAAWLSMVVINGILSFQLTPGGWLQTRGFWDGFFNPTYWPSLAARSLFSVALAGFFALIVAARKRGERRTWWMRYSGIWSAVGLVGCAVFTMWWWASVPEAARGLTGGDMPFATHVAAWAPRILAVLAALVVLGPIARPQWVRWPMVALILIVGFLTMGSGEWIREALRKPWIIEGYMYSSGFGPDDVSRLREQGIAASSPWVDASTQDPVALGEQIFLASCGNCHARDGYNGLKSRTAAWDVDYLAAFIERMEYTRRPMPPWVGTPEEAQALAAYLDTLKDAAAPAPAADGEAVFARTCSSCHSLYGFRALTDLVEGLTADDLDEYMQDMESDQMPAFGGTDAERQTLARWLADVANPATAEGGAR